MPAIIGREKGYLKPQLLKAIQLDSYSFSNRQAVSGSSMFLRNFVFIRARKVPVQARLQKKQPDIRDPDRKH